jgi:hypothetical protein
MAFSSFVCKNVGLTDKIAVRLNHRILKFKDNPNGELSLINAEPARYWFMITILNHLCGRPQQYFRPGK